MTRIGDHTPKTEPTKDDVERVLESFRDAFPELKQVPGEFPDETFVVGRHRSGLEVAIVLSKDPVDHFCLAVSTPATVHESGWHLIEHIASESIDGEAKPGLPLLLHYSTLAKVRAATNSTRTSYQCRSSHLPSLITAVRSLVSGVANTDFYLPVFLSHRGRWGEGRERGFHGIAYNEVQPHVTDPVQASRREFLKLALPGADQGVYKQSLFSMVNLSPEEAKALYLQGYHSGNMIGVWGGSSSLAVRLEILNELASSIRVGSPEGRLKPAVSVPATGRHEGTYATHSPDALGIKTFRAWALAGVPDLEMQILSGIIEVLRDPNTSPLHGRFRSANLTDSTLSVDLDIVGGKLHLSVETHGHTEETIEPTFSAIRDTFASLADGALDPKSVQNKLQINLVASLSSRESPGFGESTVERLALLWNYGESLTDHVDLTQLGLQAIQKIETEPDIIRNLCRDFLTGGRHTAVEVVLRPVPSVQEALPLPMADEALRPEDAKVVVSAFDDPTIVPIPEIDERVVEPPPHETVQANTEGAISVVYGLDGPLPAVPVSKREDSSRGGACIVP